MSATVFDSHKEPVNAAVIKSPPSVRAQTKAAVTTAKTNGVGWQILAFLGNCVYYGLLFPWLIHTLIKRCTGADDCSKKITDTVKVPNGDAAVFIHRPQLQDVPEKFGPQLCQSIAAQILAGNIEGAVELAGPVIGRIREKDPKRDKLFGCAVWTEFRTTNLGGVASQLIARKVPCRTVYLFLSALANASGLNAYARYYYIADQIREAMDVATHSLEAHPDTGWKTMNCYTFRQDLFQTDLPPSLLEQLEANCPSDLATMKAKFAHLEKALSDISTHNQEFLLQASNSCKRQLDEYFDSECIGARITDFYSERRAKAQGWAEQEKLDQESMRFPIILQKYMEFGESIKGLRLRVESNLMKPFSDLELEIAIGSFSGHMSNVPDTVELQERIDLLSQFSVQVQTLRTGGYSLPVIWKAIAKIAKTDRLASTEAIEAEIRKQQIAHLRGQFAPSIQEFREKTRMIFNESDIDAAIYRLRWQPEVSWMAIGV